MAELINSTGVIVKTSSNSCVISLKLDGSSKTFTFHKSLFYLFGVRCEGSMTNILEDGMEVELCYKVSGPEGKCRILAVWLGEKPDITIKVDTSEAIYDVIGRVVSSVDSDNFLVKDEDNNSVFIDKGVVFRDGSLLLANGALAMDEEINFDAIPFELEHPSEATYQATCAWIGAKPIMIDRFDLRSTTEFPDDIVEGTVAVIPNDVVAIVDVVSESVLTKVLLFRSSFKPDCTRLGEVVDIGDSICMRLGYKSVLVGRRWWFAVQASKSISEISIDGDSCKEVFPKVDSENNASSTLDNDVAENESTKFGKECEVLFCREPLSGVISPLPDEDVGCITFGDLKIFVHRDKFYLKGKPCSVGDFRFYVAPGSYVVYFEAILSTKPLVPENIGFTHEAVCAWVGSHKKPTVHVVGATFSKPIISSALEYDSQVFQGVVVKYYLPYIAFACVPEGSTHVFIHVSYFTSAPCYPPEDDAEKFIINYVKLGDRVEFKLQENPSSPGIWAYDVRLVHFPGEYKYEVCSDVPLTCRGKSETGVMLSCRKSAEDRVNDLTSKLQLISKKRLSDNLGFLLNWSGVLKVERAHTGVIVTVEHIFGTASISSLIGFPSEKVWANNTKMLKYNDVKVRFDALCIKPSRKNSNFRILRLWEEDGLRPDPFTDSVLQLLLTSSFARGETRKVFYSVGKVVSTPFHDAALAYFDKVPVLVPLDSLVGSEEINLNTSSIETFLKPGESIFAKVKKESLKGKSYFSVVKCFGGDFYPSEINCDIQLEMFTPRQCTWSERWGFGEWHQKAPLAFYNGEYFLTVVIEGRKIVKLHSSLFEKGRIFVHGKLANPEMLKEYLGQHINVYVYSKNAAELFVACAWIGLEPTPKLIMKNDLTVPKGLISCLSRYEVLVVEFPLPMHALCYSGHLPVLVRIVGECDKRCKYDGLKIGDRLIVSVHEETVRDSSVILSEKVADLRKANEVPVEVVFKNLTGTVVSLPKPVGKIKVADAEIEVSFEVCHLRSSSAIKSGSRSQRCLADLRNQTTVGKRVYVSAIKDELYRAFEVYFGI